MISAMRMACSSLSITHGPAIRKRFPEPMRTSPTWKEEIKTKAFHRRTRRERQDETRGFKYATASPGVLGDLGGKLPPTGALLSPDDETSPLPPILSAPAA